YFKLAILEMSKTSKLTLNQIVLIYNYLINIIEDFIDTAQSNNIIDVAKNAKTTLKQYYPISNGLIYAISI
ncbi:14040_t:CDS:1, partial [Funneliformis caledonium]